VTARKSLYGKIDRQERLVEVEFAYARSGGSAAKAAELTQEPALLIRQHLHQLRLRQNITDGGAPRLGIELVRDLAREGKDVLEIAREAELSADIVQKIIDRFAGLNAKAEANRASLKRAEKPRPDRELPRNERVEKLMAAWNGVIPGPEPEESVQIEK
jgi:hypothetical protein